MTDPRGLFAPSAIVDPTATFADDFTRVWHHSVILQHVQIGRSCSIGSRAEIGRGSIIGDRSRISAGVFLPPNSLVGAGVFIGPNATFTDDLYPVVPKPGDPPYAALPPIIGDGASIGAGAIVLPGVKIGREARIAAGAVVTKDVPAQMMVKGMPGREMLTPEPWQTKSTVAVLP